MAEYEGADGATAEVVGPPEQELAEQHDDWKDVDLPAAGGGRRKRKSRAKGPTKPGAPKPPTPKGKSLAAGITVVYGMTGMAVGTRSPGAGRVMQVAAPYAGESWDRALKRHVKLYEWLAPFLGVAEDANDVLPPIVLPIVVATLERQQRAGIPPTPQLVMMLQSMLIPVLETMAKQVETMQRNAGKMAELEEATGITLDSLMRQLIGPPGEPPPPEPVADEGEPFPEPIGFDAEPVGA